METNLPTPMTARVYVNLLEGIYGITCNRSWHSLASGALHAWCPAPHGEALHIRPSRASSFANGRGADARGPAAELQSCGCLVFFHVFSCVFRWSVEAHPSDPRLIKSHIVNIVRTHRWVNPRIGDLCSPGSWVINQLVGVVILQVAMSNLTCIREIAVVLLPDCGEESLHDTYWRMDFVSPVVWGNHMISFWLFGVQSSVINGGVTTKNGISAGSIRQQKLNLVKPCKTYLACRKMISNEKNKTSDTR